MNTLNIIAWTGMVIALLLFGIFLILVTRKNKQLEAELNRRKADHITDDVAPGAFVEYETADGRPGAPRGSVWSDHDRDIHRQKSRNVTLRMIK